MNRRAFLSTSAYASAGFIAGVRPTVSADAEITITVQAEGHEISPHIYGHFIEHLGGVIYDRVWVGTDSKIANIHSIRKQFVDDMNVLASPTIDGQVDALPTAITGAMELAIQ